MSDPVPPRSSPRLTVEQAQALAVAGASVALGAGAGCGKTTVLTERFLGVLSTGSSERNPLATIVALTFTVKAARELRQRIRAACHDQLAAVPRDQAGFWRGVLRGLEAAPISTFHEYCTAVLRRHALAAGIDPDFEVLDEALAGAVRNEALTRQIRRWLAEQNDDFIEIAAFFGLGRARDVLDELVANREADQLAIWSVRTPEDLVRRWELAWEELCRPLLIESVATAAAGCHELLASLTFQNVRLRQRQAALMERLPGIAARIDDRAWLAEVRETAKVTGPRADQWPSLADYERVKASFAALRDAIDDWCEGGQYDEAATREAAELGLRLARLAAEARQSYARAKAARGGLDFDDLILRTRDLLDREPGLLRDDPGRPVEFVLVDEFQDTDPAQSAILRALTGSRFESGGLFVVGDFKQSIYRFRGARPVLFREYRAAFPTAGRLELSENFRSNRDLIDFVNALFQNAFPGDEPRLRGGAETPARAAPAVEFVWPLDETAADESAKPSTATLRAVEARWLARILRARLAAGWPIRDRRAGPGTIRPAHAGDVAFLFRAMTDVAAYERALVAEGFDVHIVGGSAFYAQQEIQDVVNVLAAIEDPFDGVALAGALRSPFFGLSDVALFQLADGGRGVLAERFLSAVGPSELLARDQSRLQRARELLARWRSFKDRISSAALIERILDESGYEAALAGEYLGDRKRANARKLVRLARRFDARPGFTLAQVVARFREDLREPPREGEAATTDEEGTSIRLMSIHQSKGLEFPIVVLPDLNRKREQVRGAVAFDPLLGPLIRGSRMLTNLDEDAGSGESRGWAVYRSVESSEAAAESIRLFYVAATRARDALILSAGGGPDAKPQSEALGLLASRFDRATGQLLAELPEEWSIPRVGVIEECPEPVDGEPIARARRASPGEMARLLAKPASPARRPSRAPGPRPLPGFVDLDAWPGHDTGQARLAALIRVVLADAELSRRGELRTVVRRAGSRLVPRAPARMVDEAVRLLAPWIDTDLGDRLARASAVEWGEAWSISWPPEARPERAVVIQGWYDLLVRDADGIWSVGIVSAPGASESHERLRWLGSITAVIQRGLAPLGPCWRINLNEPGSMMRIEPPDLVELETALQALST